MAANTNKIGIDVSQLRTLITRVNKSLDLWSETADHLILGTIAQESAMGHYLRQIKGPAIGICQMEPATFKWLQSIYSGTYPRIAGRNPDDMEWDLWLAIAMCRLRYRAVSAPLPENTVPGIANYWKKYYNTPLGSGTVEAFTKNYQLYVGAAA